MKDLRAKLRHLPPRMLARLCPRLVVDTFHYLHYSSPRQRLENQFLGVHVDQLTMDLWLYLELVHRERPRWILQTGVYNGGSVLFFAHALDLIGAPADAVVIAIDIVLRPSAKALSHPRIRLIEGSSTAAETVAKARALMPAGGGLVSLDSDHAADHVRRELHCYADFVEPGRHLVVEDTNVYGHPLYPTHGPGPMEAVESFLKDRPDFVRDDALWQRNLFSYHQYGWLQRRA